jgi:hypothetical protein
MQGRRPTLIWTMSAALALAGAAHAGARSSVSPDGRAVTLFPGERVVVRGVEGGALALVSSVRADPASALPPKPGPRGPDAPLPDGAEPGTVAMTLGGDGGRTVLKLDSGLEQAFDYRAVLRVGNGERAGSVCTVLPLLASWEEWPYAVASVTLSGFATRTTNEVVCDPPK